MTKQFIKVTKENVAKNIVQRLCQEEIRKLDQTLWNGFVDAKIAVIKAKDTAINTYKGRAVRPILKEFKSSKNETQLYIEDVIYITIYEVIKFDKK
ncbi:hypothetical protein [Flavobacterium columnare]|uniref:Uncharacterized protein n=1 Tax=Flavobacterium columnare TaxID=996 RepID=A0AA94F2Y6_9FLAO|nr:hypothetical protein [Flavobacterium columnare]MCH4828907.1 hypothetical protein [Flavobacterium columnare]MCH4829803.1 hypothetical protein [Flavobacterium columnare]MCH4831632.1 hypothetical protein [Flavobacterium columnare]MCH4831669.1 hypothetical protein [Flavobacterium columnare]MCH4832819.1 hypothetical protein [Flavobacterium columnare]